MKVYFASDVHLGAPTILNHKAHEQLFVQWLDAIKDDADEIYLLGDIFDYWYEYKTVVPKGFVRTLGKICELTDRGIKVHLFAGNHDTWMFGYLEQECGVTLHRGTYTFESHGKRFMAGHGDGLGNFDKPYLLMKAVFESPVAQFLYSLLHPDIGGWIANNWSGHSRKANNRKYVGKKIFVDKEFQMLYARQLLAQGADIDYFVFGHRHIVLNEPVSGNSRLVVIGDWFFNFTYAVFDGETVEVKRIDTKGIDIYKAPTQ